MKKIYACLFSLMFLSLEAKIIEIDGIQSVNDYLTDDSVLFMNVGDTLFAPSSMLADYQWREYFVERVNALVSDPDRAEYLINRVKGIIVEKIPKVPPEAVTPSFIAELQERQVPVLGLSQRFFSTAYAPNNGEIVSNHLLGFGIDLSETLTYYNVQEFNNPESAFHFGILFTNKNPIGPSLVDFFEKTPSLPAHVVLVSDSAESLEEGIESLAGIQVEALGLRYGQIDARKAAFDPDIGTLEFFAFFFQNELMTDEEAEELKALNAGFSMQLVLDLWILTETINLQ
jgi:hypothetical protein